MRITVCVYAFSLEAGGLECRKPKPHDTNAQTLYEQPSQPYYWLRLHLLLEAVGP